MHDLILLTTKDSSDVGPAPPEWFKIFPAGEVLIEGEKPVVMDAQGAALILKHFNGLDHDMVIDYEHQTLTGEKAPAAGWVTKLEWRENDGLWAKANWTDEAVEYISKRAYRYFSPVFKINKATRRIVEIYNLALTNQPRMQNIEALAAKNNPSKTQRRQNMWEKLKKLLGLADTASEDDTFTKIEEVVAKNTELKEAVKAKSETVAGKEVLEALGLKEGASEEDTVKAVEGLKIASVAAKDLSLQVAKLTTSVAEIKRDDLVELALKDGQISPDEVDKWGKELAEKSPEQFTTIVLSRAKGSVIPVENLSSKEKLGGSVVPDETQTLVNKMMGIDPEIFKKYNPRPGQDA